MNSFEETCLVSFGLLLSSLTGCNSGPGQGVSDGDLTKITDGSSTQAEATHYRDSGCRGTEISSNEGLAPLKGCRQITGNLTLSHGVTDLGALATLESVEEQLSISGNPDLTSLS